MSGSGLPDPLGVHSRDKGLKLGLSDPAKIMSGSVDRQLAGLDLAAPAEVPTRESAAAEAPKRASEQFATREQTMRQAAAAAGVTRGGNEVDMLGGGSKPRSNAARKRLLGE